MKKIRFSTNFSRGVLLLLLLLFYIIISYTNDESVRSWCLRHTSSAPSSVSVDALRLMLISHVLSWHPETLPLASSRMPWEYIIMSCRIIPTANTHLSTVFFAATNLYNNTTYLSFRYFTLVIPSIILYFDTLSLFPDQSERTHVTSFQKKAQ